MYDFQEQAIVNKSNEPLTLAILEWGFGGRSGRQ